MRRPDPPDVLFLAAAAIGLGAWSALAGAALLFSFCLGAWWRGTRRAAQAIAVFDAMAVRLGLCRCPVALGPSAEQTAARREQAQRPAWGGVGPLLLPAWLGLRRLLAPFRLIKQTAPIVSEFPPQRGDVGLEVSDGRVQ